MNPARILTKQTVVLELKGDQKQAVIEELLDVLVAAGLIGDRTAALKVILERERKMSTGLQNGIAIPHGKSDTVEHLVAAVGVKKQGLAFESLDGQPARIIVLTLSPLSRSGPHIQFLADISKQLGDPAVRQRILECTSTDAVLDALCPDKTAKPTG